MSKHKNLSPIEKALLTWHLPGHELYKNSEPAILGLAGEIGEILDLYKKHTYKNGFDWMDCNTCGYKQKKYHTNLQRSTTLSMSEYHYFDKKNKCHHFCSRFAPKILDELGDLWYYLRIVAWIYNLKLILPHKLEPTNNIDCIIEMYHHASVLLYTDLFRIQVYGIYASLATLLENLDYTLNRLTELNYQKLNSEETITGK